MNNVTGLSGKYVYTPTASRVYADDFLMGHINEWWAEDILWPGPLVEMRSVQLWVQLVQIYF